MKATAERLTGRHARRIDLDAWIARERRQSHGFREVYDAARQSTQLARALVALRQGRGLSQRQLAERLGISPQTIRRLERPDYRGHTLAMVARYAEALGARLEFQLAS